LPIFSGGVRNCCTGSPQPLLSFSDLIFNAVRDQRHRLAKIWTQHLRVATNAQIRLIGRSDTNMPVSECRSRFSYLRLLKLYGSPHIAIIFFSFLSPRLFGSSIVMNVELLCLEGRLDEELPSYASCVECKPPPYSRQTSGASSHLKPKARRSRRSIHRHKTPDAYKDLPIFENPCPLCLFKHCGKVLKDWVRDRRNHSQPSRCRLTV
jgi:hypothetical protein